MIWQEYSQRLKNVLELRGSPVAVTYSMEPAKNAEPGKHSACKAILDARDGKVINLTKDSSSCPGGIWHLGLGPRPSGDQDKALKKFLVNGEKLFCSIAVFQRVMMLGTPPPKGAAENVILAPMEKAGLMPDVVLFLVNAEQACRLIQLAAYWDGINPRTELIGSGCHMAIAYPIVSGEINVTFLDWTARRTRPYKPDELIISIPYHKLPNIVEAIDKCTAGTAKLEIPPEFQAHEE
ncbi:MAG: DUF169 domain-containing protein [Armatimonadetes bacterium]|nr:DUF169 domain-containing protein [Armatimonadota bacterium]